MILILITVFIIFIVFPSHIALATRDGLLMCIKSVIPSLFPFMVISKMLIMSDRINENNLIFRTTAKIFNISTAGVSVFLLGLLCGYPIGAKTLTELRNADKISKGEAKRLMLFINNAGPAFVIATVGGMFFKDVKTGVIIYISHILSSILTGLATSFMPCEKQKSVKIIKAPLPFFKVFLNAVNDSVLSIFNVTGIIVFFSSILYIFDIVNLNALLPDGFLSVFKGLFEMTTGIKALSASTLPYIVKAGFSSFLVSFSGLSVFCQILFFNEDIKISALIISKLICGVTAMGICFILIKILI